MTTLRTEATRKTSTSSHRLQESGRFSVFSDGTPVVKTALGLVGIIATTRKVKEQLSKLQPGDEIQVRGGHTQIRPTQRGAFSGPAVSATSIKIIRHGAQAQGVFSKYLDGTFLVKTTGGAVGIAAGNAEVKRVLAGLQPGDSIEVIGAKSEAPVTGPDTYSGPMIIASEIRVTQRVPEVSTVSGSVTHIGAQPGYPSGVFLRLAKPVSVDGKAFTMVLLPGSFGSQIGATVNLKGALVIDKSANGTEFLRFTSVPTVAEARDSFTPG